MKLLPSFEGKIFHNYTYVSEALFIQQSPNSPVVNLNPKKGIFKITGPIFTDTPEDFFKPVLLWLDGFVPKSHTKTEFHFFIDYKYASGGKRVLFILYKLRKFVQNGFPVRVHWHYNSENTFIQEVGEDLANLIPEIPFHFVENSNELSLS